MSDVGPWNRILVRHVRDGFVSDDSIARQWRALNFTEPPDFGRAVEQYDRFVSVLKGSGAEVLTWPTSEIGRASCRERVLFEV